MEPAREQDQSVFEATADTTARSAISGSCDGFKPQMAYR
jgi:hypothetical protein